MKWYFLLVVIVFKTNLTLFTLNLKNSKQLNLSLFGYSHEIKVKYLNAGLNIHLFFLQTFRDQ